MFSFDLKQLLILSLVYLVINLSCGCTSSDTMHTQTVPDADYRSALEWTDPANFSLPPADSPEEADMLASVEALFTNYTHGYLDQNIPLVYAEKVYFRDAFKLLHSSAEIRV